MGGLSFGQFRQICLPCVVSTKKGVICPAYTKKPVFSGFCGRGERVSQMLVSRIPLAEDRKAEQNFVFLSVFVVKKNAPKKLGH
ncbi:MAG: hypothetical protein ABSG22_08140 [Sedimentisphaerales bacterium]|jgi:hypothetical protein